MRTFNHQFLRARRQALGLTVVQAAALAGYSRHAWTSWEFHDRKPEADALPAIAMVLCCSLDQLFTSECDEVCNVEGAPSGKGAPLSST